MSNYDNGFDKAQREYDMQEPPEYEPEVIDTCDYFDFENKKCQINF